MEQNSIILRGSLQDLPHYSHENHGRKFYRFILEVPRLSGTVDLLPVIVREDVLFPIDPTAGSMLTVTGQIRSHNLRENGLRHLLIFVFATQIQIEDGPAINEVNITGTICRTPTYRRTPLGREICDVMLAVTRSFHRADYVPCILWGKTASDISQCQIRDRIAIAGRLQSRLYNKQTDDGIVTRTAYELSALSAEILDDEDQYFHAGSDENS